VCNDWWKRKVLAESMLRSAADLEDPDPLLEIEDPGLGPGELAEIRDEAARALQAVKDPQLRHVLLRRAEGYTQAEGAAEVGLTAKAIERRLHAHRKNFRRESEHDHDGEGRA
jgi:DNA-directed RNA polymerase specialized sigma24 family protein